MNLDITYQFMIPMLLWFHKVTHSYGWSIVLLTLMVRILVWPLVANQTKSMMKMSQLQPQLKAIQERYKSEPELFQKKAMEFYSKNKINPMGGCLPLLVQLPILIALFSTFTGPPFGDKAVDVKVHVVDKALATQVHRAETSGGSCAYVSKDGALAKVIVYPGDTTVVQGESVDFATRALQGQLPTDFKVYWQIYGKAQDMKGIMNNEPFGSSFHADFPNVGEFIVKAKVPGIAKNESFGFIDSLGKVARGTDLLKPKNWDSLGLILLFGVTMFISQKYTMPSQPKSADGEVDEAQLAQRQAMKIMPITVTAMFFFIPLPAGVYLYMVISNVMQSLQTWLIMRQPTPQLVDVLDGGGGGGNAASNGKSTKNTTGQNKKAKDSTEKSSIDNEKKPENLIEQKKDPIEEVEEQTINTAPREKTLGSEKRKKKRKS